MPPIMFFSNFPFSYDRWASTPMFGFNRHCCGGNNSWMNWWMMSEMLKNIGQMFRRPQQSQLPYAYGPYSQYTSPYATMYPYLNLNNAQNPYAPTQEVDEDLLDLQKAYKDCKTKFNFVKINDKYIAITKDGHRLKAETADDLMDKIDEYINNGKGGVEHEGKEGKETAELEEEIESLKEQISTLQAEKEELENGKENIPASIVPSGWSHENNTSFLSKEMIFGNDKESVSSHILKHQNWPNKDAANCTATLLGKYYNLNIGDNKLKDLRQAIIDANPSIYDKDGKLLDGVTAETLEKKLDLPTKDILTNTYGATENKKAEATEYPQDQRVQVAAKTLRGGLGGLWTYRDKIEAVLFDDSKFNNKNCVAVALSYENQYEVDLLQDIQTDTWLESHAKKVYMEQVAGKFFERAKTLNMKSEHLQIVKNFYEEIKNRDDDKDDFLTFDVNRRNREKVWAIMKAYETKDIDNLASTLNSIDNMMNIDNKYYPTQSRSSKVG